MATPHETVCDYWAACEARDWATLGAFLTDDVVYDMPQTRERITGRAAFLRRRLGRSAEHGRTGSTERLSIDPPGNLSSRFAYCI